MKRSLKSLLVLSFAASALTGCASLTDPLFETSEGKFRAAAEDFLTYKGYSNLHAVDGGVIHPAFNVYGFAYKGDRDGYVQQSVSAKCSKEDAGSSKIQCWFD